MKNDQVNTEEIKKRALKKCKSLAAFGRKVGIKNHQVISLKLLNKSPILADEIFLMADELGVTVDELRLKP